MTNEYEALGKELLEALWNLDDNFPLRTHPDAWEAVEQFAEKLQSAAYAEGRKDEAEASQKLTSAAILWAYCPSSGAYANGGRAVEDCCEELAAAVYAFTGTPDPEVWWSEEQMIERIKGQS